MLEQFSHAVLRFVRLLLRRSPQRAALLRDTEGAAKQSRLASGQRGMEGVVLPLYRNTKNGQRPRWGGRQDCRCACLPLSSYIAEGKENAGL